MTWSRLDPEWIASSCGRWRICKMQLWHGLCYALWDWDLVECIAVRDTATKAKAFVDEAMVDI
jgi:hypothetical protein